MVDGRTWVDDNVGDVGGDEAATYDRRHGGPRKKKRPGRKFESRLVVDGDADADARFVAWMAARQ